MLIYILTYDIQTSLQVAIRREIIYMRNANGYGGIVDLGEKRRNRYAVRITDKYMSSKLCSDGTFKQKYKYIGYYPKLSEAKKALAEYNSRCTPTNYIDITFSQVWDKWCERNLTDTKTSRYSSYTSAFNKCHPIHNTKMTDLRLNDLENVIEAYPDLSQSSLNNIKFVMNFIFTWAEQNDVVNKNYANFLSIKSSKDVESHVAFKTDEISALWADKMEYKLILMYIYTGVRPNELIKLNKSDVHLDEKYIDIKQSKTKAGVRIVPISNKVLPFFEYYMATTSGKKLLPVTYSDLKAYYKGNIPNHTPHDTRSTFVSLMTAAGVAEVIIQKIVGHSGGNVTRDVYTQLELNTLLDAVNKI